MRCISRPGSTARDSARAVVRNLTEGLRYVRQTPIVLLAVVTVGVVATVGMNFTVLIPAFAQNELRKRRRGLWVPDGRVRDRVVAGGHAPRDRWPATCHSTRDGRVDPRCASLALAVTREFPVAIALMVLIGFGSILMAATGNTTIQLAVPDHLRGRVMSVYTTVFSASVPVGGLAMGASLRPTGSRSRSRSAVH